MPLTREQLETIRSGRSVRLSEQGMEVVLLRADIFDKLREQAYDDSPWTDEEMDLLAAEKRGCAWLGRDGSIPR